MISVTNICKHINTAALWGEVLHLSIYFNYYHCGQVTLKTSKHVKETWIIARYFHQLYYCLNWQAQRTTEPIVQVSQLTDTYVQNTQLHTSKFIFTHSEIHFRYKNNARACFSFAGPWEKHIHQLETLSSKDIPLKKEKKPWCIMTSSSWD